MFIWNSEFLHYNTIQYLQINMVEMCKLFGPFKEKETLEFLCYQKKINSF